MNPFDEYRERLVRAKDTNAITWFDQAIEKISKLKQPPYDLQNDRNDSRMRGYNEALRDVLKILGATLK